MDLQNYTTSNPFRKCYEHQGVSEACGMIQHKSHNHMGDDRIERFEVHKYAKGPTEHGFNPYTNNMGTTVGKCH
jgi:hypothetical protein